MTTAIRTLQLIALVGLAGATMTACGSSMSATGPSSASGTGSGAVISGRVNLAGSGAATLASAAMTPVRAGDRVTAAANGGGGGLTVTVVGTGTSTTIDPGGTFTLTGVPAGTVQLHFQGRGADAMLTISGISADDRLEIAVTLNGRDVRLESSRRVSGGNGVLVNGRVDSLDASARTLRVDGSLVVVQPSTVIRHGNRTFSFADLRVGDHVIVKGSRNGATVTATEIKVNQGGEGDDDNDGDDDNETEVRGTISLLIGTCPGLTFMVAGTPVVTNASTRFEEGACSTLRNDMRVEVEGIRRNDGSLLATEVERVF